MKSLEQPFLGLIKELKNKCSQVNCLEDVSDEFGQLLTETLKGYLMIKWARETHFFENVEITENVPNDDENIF
ncbi:hypothetical protein [Crocosphaera sp. XPORK-15E]|uniref:hypothetical protein n=1 Tax=Crocosphaera sp. XPORK-15E TaxID=3110247 RepID=UPI002B1FA758|nr:hypothetical protein [Crocosphaera sp. XPORK-15E]MEA5536799.1 hypothetical protein [Crocosphaera sp. XPORK-15E]